MHLFQGKELNWMALIRIVLLQRIYLCSTHFLRDYSCHKTILTFSAADEGRNFKQFSLNMLRCEARAFPVSVSVWLHDKSAIFYFAENAHAYESGPRC